MTKPVLQSGDALELLGKKRQKDHDQTAHFKSL